jgi:hypothetical protein
MALRQKVLQKKRLKKAKKRKQAISRKNQAFTDLQQIPVLQRGHIAKCWITDTLHTTGIGDVIITRRLSNKVLMVAFVVDIYCLGVKNALMREDETDDHDAILASLAQMSECTLQRVEPAYAKKLVLDAVAYANRLGIKPYSGYEKLKEIFADVDSNRCHEQFTFGKDGKPLLVPGPNDTPRQINEWLTALRAHCGIDEFHYLLELGMLET